MSESFAWLVKQHHAFYEVSPYYIVLEERPVGLAARTRRVQAGFDVDVYGARTEDNELAMPPPEVYALGYTELEKISQKVSQHARDSCSLEVIPSPSDVFVDVRDHAKVEGMVRIRISHYRGLDQPAGLPEQQALEEIEKELKSVGFACRSRNVHV